MSDNWIDVSEVGSNYEVQVDADSLIDRFRHRARRAICSELLDLPAKLAREAQKKLAEEMKELHPQRTQMSILKNALAEMREIGGP